jgi:hypothetical protein
MTPRYRVWIKEEKCFADYIETIRYYAKEVDLCWGGICESDCFDFEGVILMQSTGLKDKNGKEIFEGDIIAIEVDDTEAPINAKIFQNSKIGMLMFHVFEDNEDVPMVELLEDNSVAFAVIGNICENKELLDA